MKWSYLNFEIDTFSEDSSGENYFGVIHANRIPKYIYDLANLEELLEDGCVLHEEDNPYVRYEYVYGDEGFFQRRSPLVEEILNRLGAMGWELVSFAPIGPNKDNDGTRSQTYTYVMKSEM